MQLTGIDDYPFKVLENHGIITDVLARYIPYCPFWYIIETYDEILPENDKLGLIIEFHENGYEELIEETYDGEYVRTILSLACEYGYLEIVKYLFEERGYLTELITRDFIEPNSSPYMLAYDNEHFAIVEYLNTLLNEFNYENTWQPIIDSEYRESQIASEV